MRTIWHSLAWKEWHEHKWKLAALTAVLCGVNVLCLANLPNEVFSGDYLMTCLAVIPLALFVGAGVASGERAHRTEAFTQALPVPLWKPAVGKVILGLLTLLVAVAIAFIFVYCWFWCFKLSHTNADSILNKAWNIFPPSVRLINWFVSAALTVGAVAASIFIWSAFAGAGGSDEISSSARAVIIVAGWWALVAIAATQVHNHFGEEFVDANRKLIASLVAVSPGGVVVTFPKMQSAASWSGSLTPVVWGLAFHLALVAGFLYRFGRVSGGSPSCKIAMPGDLQNAFPHRPWRSPLAAIAWKQLRESAPVVAAGLASALGFTAIYAFSEWQQVSKQPVEIAIVFAGITAILGFFTTFVVGIGVSLTDSEEQLNFFWRSRPISPDAWFWTKFFTGLFALFASLFLPIAIVACVVGFRGDVTPADALAYIVAYVCVYAAAVTVTCLVRRAVYAAILSFATVYIGFGAAWLSAFVIYRLAGFETKTWRTENYLVDPLVIACVLVACFAITCLGWLAVRNDWGHKKA